MIMIKVKNIWSLLFQIFMVNLYDTSGYTALGAVAEDIAFDSLRNLKQNFLS